MAVFSSTNSGNPALVRTVSASNGQASLLWNGTSTNVGGWGWSSCSGTFSANGSPNIIPCTFNTVMWRGYMNAQYNGVYSFIFAEVDDIALFWMGDTARQGWNRTNALLESNVWARHPAQTWSPAGQNSSFVHLLQGQNIPIRILSGQNTAQGAFKFHIVDPLGNTVLSSGTGVNGNVFTTYCNAAVPPFAYDWGNEA